MTGLDRRGSALLHVVWALLALTGVVLVVVGVAVIRASKDTTVRSGLDYSEFLSAVDDLIAGAGDSALVRFAPVEERLAGHGTIRYDTIQIVADATRYPAFQRGGFLWDQARAYNRFQRERADLARTQPEWFDRLQAHNPSVFRAYRTIDGPRLTRSSAAWSLRVRSPAEEGWSGEIRAQDVGRSNGLFGSGVTIPHDEPVRLIRRVEGRHRTCEFIPEGEEMEAFCLSEQRIPQATFRLLPDRDGAGSARAGWANLWVDGVEVPAGESTPMPLGALVRVRPLEPVVFGEYWDGVLSSKQWINGRMSRRSEFAPPLDLFAPLANITAVDGAPTADTTGIDLAVDAAASIELTARLQDFLDDRVPLDIDFGIVVIGRIDDGEIKAVGEVGHRRSRGRSNLLERITPGSAVKPLTTAAVLSQRPELGTLRIPMRSGSIRSVLGMPPVPERRAFQTALNCPVDGDGWIDLTYFLRCSNNEYAAALVTAGLWEGDGMSRAGTPGAVFELGRRRIEGRRPDVPISGSEVSRATLLGSPLSEGLNDLFDIPSDPTIADSVGRSDRAWEGLEFSDGSPVRVPTELLATESRPALLAPSHPDGTDLGLLYRYAFGAWENGWNLIDLTTGFGRVVTDRRIQLRFGPQDGGSGIARPTERARAREPDANDDETGTPPDALGLAAHPWYPAFLDGLRRVATDGTAPGLRDAWVRQGLPRGVFAKTGTLAEPGQSGPADDLFIKSLLFAVGQRGGSTGAPLECGLVGGIYLRFTEGPRDGSLPSYQVEFARTELARFLEEHWERFGACGGG